MRCFSLLAILLALVGAAAVAIVGRSRANDPQPAAKSGDDDPFGGDGNAAPAKSSAASPAPTQPSFAQESMPTVFGRTRQSRPSRGTHRPACNTAQQTRPTSRFVS